MESKFSLSHRRLKKKPQVVGVHVLVKTYEKLNQLSEKWTW